MTQLAKQRSTSLHLELRRSLKQLIAILLPRSAPALTVTNVNRHHLPSKHIMSHDHVCGSLLSLIYFSLISVFSFLIAFLTFLLTFSPTLLTELFVCSFVIFSADFFFVSHIVCSYFFVVKNNFVFNLFSILLFILHFHQLLLYIHTEDRIGPTNARSRGSERVRCGN